MTRARAATQDQYHAQQVRQALGNQPAQLIRRGLPPPPPRTRPTAWQGQANGPRAEPSRHASLSAALYAPGDFAGPGRRLGPRAAAGAALSDPWAPFQPKPEPVIRQPIPQGNPRHDWTIWRQREAQGAGEPIERLLGAEHFGEAEKPVTAPADQKMLTISAMARACNVKINTVWKYEDGPEHIMPPSIKGSRNRRLYPEAYVRGVEAIALDEGLHSKPRTQVSRTRFSERCWQLARELGMQDA